MTRYFQTNWGDIASAAGLVISIIGFTLAFLQLRSARLHFGRALAMVSSFDVLASIAIAKSSMDEAIMYCENHEWTLLTSKLRQIRSVLLAIAADKAFQSSDAISKLRMIQAQIKSSHESMQSFSQNNTSRRPQNYRRILKTLNDQADALSVVDSDYRSHLLQREA